MKFKTKIHQSGNNTGIIVPEKIVESFNAGKKPQVVITINNYTYRNTVAVMGGKYMVSLSAEHRKNANIAGGDEAEITIELDTAPRVTAVPGDFQKALDKNAKAKKFFEALSPSYKKKYVTLIEDAKTEETRNRRIEKAVKDLSEGKK